MIHANRNDLAFVTVELLDPAGIPVPDGVRTVDFQIEGVGELAAAGSANPKDVGASGSPPPEPSAKCMAILRPSGQGHHHAASYLA